MNFLQTSAPSLILIIDDDDCTRFQLRRVMEHDGYRVVEATNGEEGLALYTKLHPDLILLDAMMPTLDGFAFCAQLQGLPWDSLDRVPPQSQLPEIRQEHAPVLMITGLEDEDSVERAFAVGAADYITKPIHWAVLRQRVHRLIKQYYLYQQLQYTNQQLQQLNQSLHHLATIDGLTQVANRRQFDICLDQEWRRLAREQKPISLILVDIDYFKRYNDAYGHPAGDQCLRQVASIIQSVIKRPADLVSRYGGEEFAVILPSTNQTGALCVAEEIRSQVNKLALPHQGSAISEWVTLSQGVACAIPSQAVSPLLLIDRADQALYQAKESGRDRVCAFVDSELNHQDDGEERIIVRPRSF